METLKIRITFTEEILGMSPSDPAIHEEYIASKAPDALSREEEVAAIGVDGVIEKSITVFPRNDAGEPIFFDYQLKGFFKDACSMLTRVKGVTESSKLKAYRKIIDGLIFVKPRMIPIVSGGEFGNCQRPLRTNSPQGERTALAHSETIPAGAYIDAEISLLDPAHEAALVEWLDYGALRGMGQWRNSGKGCFTWERRE